MVYLLWFYPHGDEVEDDALLVRGAIGVRNLLRGLKLVSS